MRVPSLPRVWCTRQPLEVAQIHLSKKQEKNTAAADTPTDSKVLAVALGHEKI